EGLAILSGGRDPLTNRVAKDVFLTYAGVTKITTLLADVFTGRVTNGDNTFYMGLGSLLLLPLSLAVRPSPPVRALLGLGLFLLLFSTGGMVASVSYYFPGMSFYRHVSIVFGLFRIVAFLCVGYLLDRMVHERALFADWRRWLSGWRLVAGLAVVGLTAIELTRAQLHGPDLALILFPRPADVAQLQIGVLATRLFCYAMPLIL